MKRRTFLKGIAAAFLAPSLPSKPHPRPTTTFIRGDATWVGGTGFASRRTFYVGPTPLNNGLNAALGYARPFPTIAEALKHCEGNDRIVLLPGV